MNWNVDGFLTKLDDPDLPSYLSSFSFICLTETFLYYFDNSQFLPEFDCYISPAKKLSSHGRHSGGVVCFVRKCLADYIKVVECSYENMLVFNVSRNLFLSENDILLVAAYVPPLGSPFYNEKETDNGILLLEECIMELDSKYNTCDFVLCGDLNSRTSNLGNRSDHVFDPCRDPYDHTRFSQDKTINTFGRSLLTMCLSFNLTILNGLFDEESGAHTYVSSNGCSVIDYCIVSTGLLWMFKSLRIVETVLSPHFCVEVDVCCMEASGVGTPYDLDLEMRKIVWNSDLSDDYVSNLKTYLETVDVDEATLDVDSMTEKLSLCFTGAGEFMKKTYGKACTRKGQVWFDKECRLAKKGLQKL